MEKEKTIKCKKCKTRNVEFVIKLPDIKDINKITLCSICRIEAYNKVNNYIPLEQYYNFIDNYCRKNFPL